MPSTIIAYGVMEMGLSLAAATFMANMAVSFALSFVVTRMFGATPPSQQDQGTRQQIPPNTANSIPMVYGDAYLGGTFIDACLTTDQKTMYYVLAISTISPNGTFTYDTTKMYYGDRLITFGTGASVASLSDQAIPPNIDTTIAGNLEIYLYTSNATGTITPVNTSIAPSTVMGSGSGLASAFQWTGTRQMNGLAFAIVKLNYSREAQTTSLQPITFKVAQNLDGLDRARPGDVWYDYITNIYYGGAIDAAYVDTTTRDALNTYSDQTITYTPSGGGTATQRRYKINGVINAGETVLNNIDKILMASDSWMAYNAPTGKWSIIINKAESTSYAFDDDNIIGDIRVSATDITSSINEVEAKFPNKDNKDQPAYVNIATPSGLLYPNEPTNKYSITFDLVNDNVQAQYLSNRLLEQAREDLIVSFNTTYYGIQVDAGNVISVTNSSYGWSDKLFRVMKVNEVALADGTLGAKLDLNEYNAQVYDDQDITAFTPSPNSGLPSPVYFSALQAPTVTGYPSASSPTFSVSVYIPITGRVTFGTLFYTTVASPAVSDWYQLDFAQTVNSQPVTNSTSGTPVYYTFANEKLAAGTYYFAYVVGNETSQSALSAMSTAFVWAPVAPTGPTGPTGSSVTGPTGATGSAGTSANKYATAYLYQWSTTTPSNPSGTSTYTWSTGASSAYSGGGGWSTTVPANAGTSGLQLWVASKQVTDTATATTTSVSWTSGFSTYVAGQNGTAVNGVQTARPTVYQWALSTPSISGTSTYTWSTGAYTAPSGWATTISTSPSSGYTLYAATVPITDSATATTTTINWTTASIVTAGYAGANGLSSRITYARVASNPTPTSGNITTSGSSSFPTSSQSTTTWGFAATWSGSDPNPSSTNSLYQSDGIYDPSTGNTTWSTPYISSLKVGALSAVSTNTGSLTISGTLQSNTAAISGTTMTGSGGVLYSTGLFAFGNSTYNITYNGSILTLNGPVVAVGSLISGTSGTYNTYASFGLGTSTSASGWLAAATFASTNVNYAGMVAVNTGAGPAIGGATTSTVDTRSAIVGFGASNSSVSTYRNLGALGSGDGAGIFQTAGSGNLASVSPTADIRLGYYNGGTSYAFYIYSGASFPFTAGHDAMQLLTDSVPDIGDLMVDVSLIAAPTINDAITQMTVSTSANQKGVIGVFVGVAGEGFVPAALGEYVQVDGAQTVQLKPEYADIYDTYRCIGINAIGEGKINVCGQGGDIEIGDFICASDMAGKGMKQGDDLYHSYTVAKARQAVTFSSPDEVVQIACIYVSG